MDRVPHWITQRAIPLCSMQMDPQSNHWAGHHQLSYKIYFLFHITIWEVAWRGWNFKMIFFFIFSQPIRHTLIECDFTFSICFKCQMTIGWSTLTFSATSHVLLRGSASTIAFNWSLSTSDDWLLCSSSSRLISFVKLLEPSLHCTSVSSSWAKCVDVMSCFCCFKSHFELK